MSELRISTVKEEEELNNLINAVSLFTRKQIAAQVFKYVLELEANIARNEDIRKTDARYVFDHLKRFLFELHKGDLFE